MPKRIGLFSLKGRTVHTAETGLCTGTLGTRDTLSSARTLLPACGTPEKNSRGIYLRSHAPFFAHLSAPEFPSLSLTSHFLFSKFSLFSLFSRQPIRLSLFDSQRVHCLFTLFLSPSPAESLAHLSCVSAHIAQVESGRL